MPIPFLVWVLVGGALWGGKKALDGLSDFEQAKQIQSGATTNHKQSVGAMERKRDATNNHAQSYGELLLQARRVTFGRFVEFVEALGHRGSVQSIEMLESVDVRPPHVEEFRIASMQAPEVVMGLAGAVAAGGSAAVGVPTLVGLYGTASTGTAINVLGGVAARNAVLAWLGGGSLAAGGGGMAAGALVLGGITFVPALAVVGVMLANKGKQALRDAEQYRSKVDQKIANLDSLTQFLGRVIKRIDELQALVTEIDNRANLALDYLDTSTFNVANDLDVKKFQEVGLMVSALSEIMKTPVLDEKGNLTDQSSNIQLKYRSITGSNSKSYLDWRDEEIRFLQK
ncbi:MAG: hypothetical protein WBG50_25620 [Desulfomonilaceae bacterium]